MKSNQCMNNRRESPLFSNTSEKRYAKTTIAKKVTEKTTIGIKTVKTSQHRFPTPSLFMPFHAIVNSFF